jgi:hypothetical protein
MHARLLALLALGSLGCAAVPSVAAPPARPMAAAASAAPAKPSVEDVRVTLEPDGAAGVLRVEIATARPAGRWTLPSGASEVTETREALRYTVTPQPAGACPFVVTPDEAFFCGDAVLAMPAVDSPHQIELRLQADGELHARASSSLGDGGVVRARFAELGRAAYVFGAVHHAAFDAHEGRDRAAWLGYFSFDPRWVAAEAAGVRSGIDRWLGVQRPAGDPAAALLLVSTGDTTGDVHITPRLRGALVAAGPSAVWSVRPRLELARLFVQRTLGGAVTLDAPGAASWFDHGVAHGVALAVLRDLGVVTRAEAVAEMNTWLAEEVLSPHAGTPVAALADGDEEARRLLAARGALLAVSLGDALQGRVRAIVAGRRATFFDSETERAAFESGAPVAIGVDPCLRVAQRTVHAFSLGFARVGDAIATVEPAAARAGLRVGDVVDSLEYADERSDVPVRLRVTRDGESLDLEYLPRGAAHRARALVIASREGACGYD